jgi:hypothetical protein
MSTLDSPFFKTKTQMINPDSLNKFHTTPGARVFMAVPEMSHNASALFTCHHSFQER